MNQIHLDESGTPLDQIALVVCGIVTMHDDQRFDLEMALRNAIRRNVPAKFRENLIVHASKLMQSDGFGNEWPLVARVEFLELVMGLPSQYGASIAFGVHRHGTDIGLEDRLKEGKLTKSRYLELSHLLPHIMALEICLDKANRVIRRDMGESAVGIALYEDLPERRKIINAALQMVRDWSNPRNERQKALAEEHKKNMERGGVHVSTVDAIVGAIQFAKKGQAPLLQFADVCAYGLRRWYANLAHGSVYYRAMGGTADRTPFDAASSSSDIIWSKMMVQEIYMARKMREENEKLT